MKSVEEILKAHKNEKTKRPAESVAEKVQRFISGAMPSEEMNDFSQKFAAEIDAALQEPARKKGAHARAIWGGKESANQYHNEQGGWMSQHPQMGSDTEIVQQNIEAITRWMIRENLAPSTLNVEAAFTELTLRGELVLDAAAAQAGPETQVTGEALRRHPLLWKLLEPVRNRNADPEQQKINRMSADEFRRSRSELTDNRTPPIALAQMEKALATFASFHPEYIASEKNRIAMMTWLEEVALPVSAGSLDAAFDALCRSGQLELNDAVTKHGATKFTDYDRSASGHPAQPSKHSFQKKIESMTADEIAERCANDPEFKAALDALEK